MNQYDTKNLKGSWKIDG